MVAEKLVKCELQGDYGAAEGAAQPHKPTFQKWRVAPPAATTERKDQSEW